MVDQDIMLGDVLGSPLLTKLQAMESHSAGFHDHHQASSHDYIFPRSSYDIVPLSTQQDLYHTMGNNLVAFSSTASPPPLTEIVKDAALINHHLLNNASSTSPYMQSACEQEKGGQEEDEAAMLANYLPTCSSLVGPRNDHNQDLSSSYQSYYVSRCSVGCDLSSPYDTLLEHVQYDPCQDLVSENLSFLKDHFQGEDYSSLIASDVQDSNTSSLNCMINGGGGYPRIAALATSSSSSSTPSSISANIGQLAQLARETLQAAWMGYGTSSFNGEQSELVTCNNNTGKVDMDMNDKRRNRVSDANSIEQKKKRRKRKRISYKNVEEMETQRMTHIAVERNRRKQMNEHLRALRLLMPQSYIQRGDQASIVGATIRFVEELEQVLQSLKLQKQLRTHHPESYGSHVEHNHEQVDSHVDETFANTHSCMANVEVTMLTSTKLFMKVKVQKKPHQLLHTMLALSNLPLRVTHLNITTIGLMIIYLFNLEMDNGDCQLLTPFELAELIKHMLCVRIMLKPRED